MNWGIIGLGKIAHKFAQDLQTLPDAKIFAVASTSDTRSEAFAKQYNVKYAYNNYEDLVNCKGLDVVYIATPHILHHDNTMMCLSNEIPVLCEKPFGMNSNEVREMIATARAYDTFLMEALWTRFLPTTIQVLDIVQSGVIGDIITIQADFGFRMPYDPSHRVYNRKLGGGALLDVGIYPVFLSLLLLGEPNDIKAKANFGTTGVDETCGIILQYNNGSMAILYTAITTRTPTTATIYGTKGNIHIHSRFHEPNEGFTLQMHGAAPQLYNFNWDSLGYKYEAIEVMNCLKTGKKESDLLPLSFSLKLMNLLDAIRQKAGIIYQQDEMS